MGRRIRVTDKAGCPARGRTGGRPLCVSCMARTAEDGAVSFDQTRLRALNRQAAADWRASLQQSVASTTSAEVERQIVELATAIDSQTGS